MPPSGVAFFMSENPHSFRPRQEVLSCPSFGPIYKTIVLGAMLSLTLWGYRLATGYGWEWNNPILMFVATYAMLVYMSWVLLSGRTTLTATELKQDWFWKKSVPLDGIAYVRFFRIKGLEWLIAPRLYIRTGSGPMRGYHAYDEQMWAEFERWSAAVAQHLDAEH